MAEQLSERSIEENYLDLLGAVHYLGGALNRLVMAGQVDAGNLQIALTEAGNNVEDGDVARILREEAARLEVPRRLLDNAVSVYFGHAFNLVHNLPVRKDK